MAISWTYEYYCSRLGVKFEYEDHFICKGPAYTSAYTNSASLGYDFTNDPTEKMFYGYASDAGAPSSVGYPILFMHLSGALQYYIKDSSIYQNVSGTQMNYTLTLNPNGGTASSNGSSLTVTINSQNYNAISSWLPSRSGYSFKGFYNATSGGTQIYTASGAITNDGTYWKNNVWIYKGNVTLYAQWTPNKYQITYNANGGTGAPGTQTFTFDGGEKISTTKPTRNGYSFVKWVSNPNNQDFAPGATIPNGWGSFTLVAQWSANTITITLDPNGGSGGTTKLYYKYNTNTIYSNSALSTKITTITKPSQTGYTFSKYVGDGTCGGTAGKQYVDSAGTISGDLYKDIYTNATLKAQWSANKYSVKFNGNGATSGSMNNQAFTYGEAQALTANTFSNTGHNFSGWAKTSTGAKEYLDKQSVSNLTSEANGVVNLYALWDPAQYTLTINPNGGKWNNTTSNSTVSRVYNTAYTVSNPTRTGHTFSGWTKSGSGTLSGSVYTFGAGDGTLKASWTINKYTLTVNANGGTWSGTTPVTQNYGTTLNIVNPQRDGYTFKGWTINGAGSISGTTFTFGEGNTTLVASWENNSSNIYFYK